MASDHSRGAAWLLVFGTFSLLACERKPDARPTPPIVVAAPSAPQATSRGPVLVVLSSRNELALKDGRTFKTGYFLNELMIPVRALVAAHYQPVFATPAGGPAVMDTHSDSASFFANDAEYREIVALRQRLNDVQETRVLASVVSEGLGPYRALLVPGRTARHAGGRVIGRRSCSKH